MTIRYRFYLSDEEHARRAALLNNGEHPATKSNERRSCGPQTRGPGHAASPRSE
jgi:hypothetical protein